MTQPKIATFYNRGGRFYSHPGSGEAVPGVTTVLGMLPKPFLKAWAAKVVATEAVEGIDHIAPMARRDPAGAIDYLKRAPGRTTQAAADIGSSAHGIFESMLWGHTLGPVTDDLLPFVRQYQDFLDTVQPEPIMTEDTVWSETYGYAGSFDALMTVQGHKAWTDNKTTRSGVYPEVALQLSAYRHADYVFDAETGEQCGLPRDAEHGLVVHVRPEKWGVYEVPIGPEVFEVFLHLRNVFEWDRAARSIIGRPALAGSAK